MKKIIIMSVFAAAALFSVIVGCNRKIDSLDPVRVLPDPLQAPINLTALIGVNAVTLNWEMVDASGVSFYRIYMTDSIGGTMRLRDTSYGTSRTIGGLVLNKRYSFSVAAMRSSGDEGSRSSAIHVQIPALSVVINSNAQYTNNVHVTVTLNAGIGATEYQLSEDQSFVGAPILGFSADAQFSLSVGDGTKRVYARFYYSDGSRTNAVLSDEIILDTRASISSFAYTPAQASFQTGETVSFIMNAGELHGTAEVDLDVAPKISLYDDGIFPDVASNDGIYTGRWLIPIGVSTSGTEVSGTFTDAAGNGSLPYKAPDLLVIHATPEPVTIVSTIALSTFEISLSWTPSNSPSFQGYRLYRALNSNVNTTSTLVETINTKSVVGYTDTSLTANTQYFYRIYVVDSFGFTAASNVDSARTQVNVAPTAVSLAGSLSGDSSTFQLSWTQSEEVDFASYRIYRKNSPGVTTSDLQVKIINEKNTDNTTDFVPGPTTVYYRVFVFDKQGLSTGSNEISLTK